MEAPGGGTGWRERGQSESDGKKQGAAGTCRGVERTVQETISEILENAPVVKKLDAAEKMELMDGGVLVSHNTAPVG